MDIDELTESISRILQDRYDLNIEVIPAKKSDSKYIKINGVFMIRVSDHYSHRDSYCKYNIGSHIKSFHKLKGSYYYQESSSLQLIHKIIKNEVILKKKHYDKKI
mgnify:CR=1 FL=1